MRPRPTTTRFPHLLPSLLLAALIFASGWVAATRLHSSPALLAPPFRSITFDHLGRCHDHLGRFVRCP